MPRFTFQPSMIWENGDPVDDSQPQRTVKVQKSGAAGEACARRKLSKAFDGNGEMLGRKWVLIREEK